MAANVLRSKRAVEVSVHVVRAFVRLRTLLASHADLARKLEELEQRYDEQFREVCAAIRSLMRPPEEESRPYWVQPGGVRFTAMRMRREKRENG